MCVQPEYLEYVAVPMTEESRIRCNPEEVASQAIQKWGLFRGIQRSFFFSQTWQSDKTTLEL